MRRGPNVEGGSGVNKGKMGRGGCDWDQQESQCTSTLKKEVRARSGHPAQSEGGQGETRASKRGLL